MLGFRYSSKLRIACCQSRLCSSVEKPIENFLADEQIGLSEEEIERKRNISRMAHRMYTRKLKKEFTATYPQDVVVKQLRRSYVSFGDASGINPGVCWPSKEEMKDLHFIRERFYPTFASVKKEVDERARIKEEAITQREELIEQNLEKLKVWRKEMLEKEQRKEKEESARKAKLDERIREVREYIGYNIAPSDPKFQEVMEQKEAERKAAEKEARKVAKKERMMMQLMNVAGRTIEDTKPSEKADSKASTPASPSASSKLDVDSKTQTAQEATKIRASKK